MPNKFGGRENLESVEFFKHLNSMVIHQRQPGTLDDRGGIDGVAGRHGAGRAGGSRLRHYKWNMGWMHDTLHYMEDGIRSIVATTITR